MLQAPNYLKNEINFDAFDIYSITLDTPTLSSIIQKTYQLARDPRLSLKYRSTLQMQADRMSDQLRTLAQAIFDGGTPQLVAANAEIASVNSYLESEAAKLDKIAQTVELTAELVGAIDVLLKIFL